LARGRGGEPDQDFDRLSRTIFGRADHDVCLVVFDALQLAGDRLTGRAWHERRSTLEAVLPALGVAVSVIDVFEADPAIHARLVALGFEGSVLKRRDGRYCPVVAHALGASSRRDQRPGDGRDRGRRSRGSGIVERVGCRAAAEPDRLTWAIVWNPMLRARLTRDPRSAIGREATVSTRTARSPARSAKHASHTWPDAARYRPRRWCATRLAPAVVEGATSNVSLIARRCGRQ
jgi:hypothetical protein